MLTVPPTVRRQALHNWRRHLWRGRRSELHSWLGRLRRKQPLIERKLHEGCVSEDSPSIPEEEPCFWGPILFRMYDQEYLRGMRKELFRQREIFFI